MPMRIGAGNELVQSHNGASDLGQSEEKKRSGCAPGLAKAAHDRQAVHGTAAQTPMSGRRALGDLPAEELKMIGSAAPIF